MAPNPQLESPGSSSYSSNVTGLHVGDGTWDSGRDDFLLPNLVGLPFDVMRYNGMGNRFAGIPQYHHIVTGHGVMAAITFLFIVPAAIMVARFYHRNPVLALRTHVWLQIITVFFATVVLILGWFAVGPKRSLTNPHHGIGVAIYTLIMFQALFGAWVRHHEGKRFRDYVPIKLMLHQWLGRAIALLAIAQVALGLTLYGSPKSLFVLYTLWVFFLLFLYFVLSYRHQPAFRVNDGASFVYSTTDVTGPGGRPQRQGFLGRIAPLAAAGGAGAAIATLLGRRNRQVQSAERIEQRTDITEGSRRGSRPPSRTSFVEEKYTEDGHPHTWRDRLLGATAGVGLFEGARRLFGGRREDVSEVSYQNPPHSAVATETDIRRVEEGRIPISPSAERIRRTEETTTIPVATASPSRRSALRARRSGDSIHSYDSALSYASPGRDKRRNYTVRDGIAALGLAGYFRHRLNQRRERREDQRVAELRERDREEERIARMDSQRRRYTGDGIPRPTRRTASMSESELSPITGSNPALSRHDIRRVDDRRNDAVSNPNVPAPPPFGHATPQASPGAASDRHRLRDAAVPLAAGVAGAAVGAAAAERRSSSRRRGSVGEQSSPPTTVKVKLRNDGRHVTLQRVPPSEGAADRQARRLQRRRRERNGSFSSVGASGDEARWRRTEAREAAQAAEMQREREQQEAAQHNTIPPPPPDPAPIVGSSPLPPGAAEELPPPPPIPASGLGGSPGSGGYDSSAVGSRAESNRRRRRAERARLEQQERERRGNRVDFT